MYYKNLLIKHIENTKAYLNKRSLNILFFLSKRYVSNRRRMSKEEEKAKWQNNLLQPPPRRFMKPNEASSSASMGTDWRSKASQHLRPHGNHLRGAFHNNMHQQHSGSRPFQQRPNHNNYGSRQAPYTAPLRFSQLLLSVKHEDAGTVIYIIFHLNHQLVLYLRK